MNTDATRYAGIQSSRSSENEAQWASMYGYGISTFSLKHHKEGEHRNGKEDQTFAMHVDTFALES